MSVSRQFSSKFHAFFNTIIIKGEVLGTVDHFYWKKEYQTRGAPHYHVLLWIRDAPMIGRDDPSKVLAWIEERITCHIPDQENNPELHNLVTRYQLHKCSNYCKRKRKRGKTFVTTCKFGFPREPSESPKVHCVEEKLKKRQKIYQITRTEAEVRVNDYNPLLLLLWKANMDIQFVSESSLALAHYVSGYVTKAERSNMSEIWQEVSESKTIYGRLWGFGVRMLRSRECGLYEASDLLLGDHLFEKSDAVQWIDVSMPHKRNRRLKDHSELLEMESTDPDSENIFKESLYSNYYPDRPEELQDLCLYDFVANFDWYGKDSKGQAYIHMRLEELFGASDWFGGRNVLFVGDLLQLQPVNGSPVFEMISKKSLCLKLGCAASVNIWKDCVEYDELTINERQKKDVEYSNILDCIRRGHLSQEAISVLQERVIDVTISEKIAELQNLKMSPVCLFPTRKQCDDVNQKMLNHLETEKHVIYCTDEVDETKSTAKWHEKAAKQLEKLNHDCNNTAGLEAVLTLAVGARVMLRRNVNVKCGLVNGAIGTVVAISPTCIAVKFDHLTDTCDIEQVRSKFIVMKNYYVYRTQFPLFLAYAVTIHKCQGLSLHCKN